MSYRNGIIRGLTLGLLTFITGTPTFAEVTVIKVMLWDRGANAQMVSTMTYGSDVDLSGAGMGIHLSESRIKAGQVKFEVLNSSSWTVHEMLILPLKEGSTVPMIQTEEKIDEEAMGAIGEVPETEPGKTGAATFDLPPGKYLVSCNIPGHYMNGMWAVLTTE